MEVVIHVDITEQTINVKRNGRIIFTSLVSTAANGVGEKINSYQTPRGWHYIHEKIGHNMPEGAVFVGRAHTGEFYSEELYEQFPSRDWILTRILWLGGLDIGKNKLGEVDTLSRYIYIHGTPNKTSLGSPGSRGCIRMNNRDLIELFDLVEEGARVLIC